MLISNMPHPFMQIYENYAIEFIVKNYAICSNVNYI